MDDQYREYNYIGDEYNQLSIKVQTVLEHRRAEERLVEVRNEVVDFFSRMTERVSSCSFLKKRYSRCDNGFHRPDMSFQWMNSPLSLKTMRL